MNELHLISSTFYMFCLTPIWDQE